MIPPLQAPEEIVHALLHRNLIVRRKSYFPDMKRANKSRVTVKFEPFTVSLTATDKPRLVPTDRFARFEEQRWSQMQPQPAPSQWHEEVNSSRWTDQACDGSICTRDDVSGSLSLDSLAKMTPALDQKSRSDYVDMAFDLDL
jgi:hypothetical protein